MQWQECAEPPAGWLKAPTLAAFRGALGGPLLSDIENHPELYAGFETEQFPDPSVALPPVEIIRTKVDPATLRFRVEGLFPYAVCLTWEKLRSAEIVLVLDQSAVGHFSPSQTAFPAPFVTTVR
jgi:hypothetical protein